MASETILPARGVFSLPLKLGSWKMFLSLALSFFVLVCDTNVYCSELSTSLSARGKHCVETAREAHSSLTEKRAASEVIAHLETLKQDGKHLLKTANDQKDKLSVEERDLLAKQTKLEGDKNEIETKIGKLHQDKSAVDKKHAQQEATLKDRDNSLKRAQKDLQDAEHALSKAKKKRKKKKKRGGLLGGIVGGIIGGPIGAIAGGLLGNELGGSKGKVDGAKNNVQRRKAELTSAQKELGTTKQSLATIQKSIKDFQIKIGEVGKQRDTKHNEIGAVRKLLAFQQKSIVFWELFIKAAEHADGRTERLKSIVDKAAEKEDLKILRADGTVTVAKSFLEAWEAIATNGKIM